MSSIRSGSLLHVEAFRRGRIGGTLCAVWLAVQLAGCGGGDAPPAPAAPASETAAASGPPAAEGGPASAGSPAKDHLPRPASGSPLDSGFSREEGPSGDTEPAGTETVFEVLDESEKGGSVFAFDSTGPGKNVDRFVVVAEPSAAGSGQFRMPREGAGNATTSTAPPVPLPDGFTAIQAAGYSPDGFPWRVRCEKDDALLAYVPAGVFLQGKNGSVPHAAPEHAVALDGFYIDLYEVTSASYEKFRDASRISKRLIAEPARTPGDFQEPVTGLTWAEARSYAVWCGRELPTEAEWEKAARGETGFDFPWGNGPYVWQRARNPGQIDAVGSFPGDQSPFGVFDMAGNAREWCADLFQEQYYAQLVKQTGAVSHNPTGPKSTGGAHRRVVKGGDPNWHVWARGGLDLSDRPADVGFRCAWHPKASRKRR
jgi:formylglycine-generating enzyme required for sulfatase activity